MERRLLDDLLSTRRGGVDISCLSPDELDQFEKLFDRVTSFQDDQQGTRQNSTALGDTQSKPESKQPKSAEMLNVVSHYETGLMNAVTRTLSLLHGLQSAWPAKDEETRTIQGH